MTFSWGLWLILFFLMPVSYGDVEYSVTAILTLSGLLFCFALGVLFFAMLPKQQPAGIVRMSIEADIYKFVFYLIFAAGCFGVLLKMYEHFILHGLLSQPSFFAYKLSRMQNQLNSGLIGVLSALTYPFGLVALMLNIKFQYLTGFFKKTVIWSVGCFWFFDAVFLSSLTTIIYLFVFLFITVVLNNSLYKTKNTYIPWLRLLLGLVITISYFIYLTFFRVDLDFIPIALEARALIPSFNIDSVLLFSVVNFLHYIVHGVVEWFRLFNHVGLEVHYLGSYQFYPIVKILSILGFNIPSFLELADVAHKTGVYTTFWGAFILDFGYYSFLAAFILGVVSMSLYNGLFNSSFISYLVYPVLAAQLIFSSIMNIFSGVVVYYLVAIFLSMILLHSYKRNVQ